MARKGARKITETLVPQSWRVGDRVRVLRQLKSASPAFIGCTGTVAHVSPYAEMYNDGAGKVFQVELDDGKGAWYFGSASLVPEHGAAQW